jgi:uncharacterized protein YndB with AHSA1/START domain
MSTMTATTTQVYELYIRATPEQIWEAITTPEFTTKYFYGARITINANGRKSTSPDGSQSWGDGAVLEYDPPRRLVHEWLSLYDPELAAEEPSRVTWEIEASDGGYSKLTVVHDRLEGAPKTAQSVSGGGWMMVLSGLKTLLETGEPLAKF